MATTTLPNAVTRKSIINLVAVNLGTVIIAIVFQWPLMLMVWPFFLQNIVIGYYSRKRILALNKFSTKGLKINGRYVSPTPETQRNTANFFAIHFGGFHLIYFVFLLPASSTAKLLDWIFLGLTAVSFAWNHRHSYHQHIEADSQGCPNIGTLMFLPYLRVVPMHIIIVTGLASNMTGVSALLLFGALKTFADVAMHYAEHRSLSHATKQLA